MKGRAGESSEREAASDGGDATSVERPPFGRRWATLYALVLVNLAVLVLLFYIFTRAFS